ncbi:unnamed protein product [Discula destructiva]
MTSQRPDLRPPPLNIATRSSLATPGYLFTSPTFTGPYRPDSGPYIFDTNGTLIWSGATATGASGASNTHNLHLCTYHSAPHLCLWQGTVRRGTTGRGVGLILNQQYQVVRTVHSHAPGTAADFHEFTLTPEGTALIVTYTPKFLNGLWILENCLEEFSLDDDIGQSIHWCATDHIPLDENPGRKHFVAEDSGNGKVPDRAWDYVHFNSIDKTPEGDYLVSARHLDTIFLISGASGDILWRLGGPSSSFALDKDANFARQHDARYLNTTHVSLFNNANDGSSMTGNPSAALILALDFSKMAAHKAASYGTVPPSTNALHKGYIASTGMGNVQLLPSTNVLTSFGHSAALAEYAPSGGAPLFYADMIAPTAFLPTAQQWSATNYRATLHPTAAWAGGDAAAAAAAAQPAEEPPSLWTYARTPAGLMTFYVSWNGATGVDRYRFWAADEDGGGGPGLFQYAGVRSKTGFETNVTIGRARPWAFAEALDAQGRSLRNSSVVRTYVPAEADRKGCGKWHCFPEVKAAVDLLPFEGGLGRQDGESYNLELKGRFDGLGMLALLEHILALVGIGMCALLVWTQWRGWRSDRNGYRAVEKGEEPLV